MHDDTNIASCELLSSPETVRRELPVSVVLQQQIRQWRREIVDIITGRDRRLLVIVGPCSVHHPAAALEYARRLLDLRARVAERYCLVMRAYFEKPRTTLGWKGLIYDPDLNGDYNIEKGIVTARQLLLDLAAMGMPAASEVLDPVMSVYLTDLLSWAGIGARTTESPTHRQLASGLPTAVGFKNGTDGGLKVALDALATVSSPHSFIGVMRNGHTGVFRTRGNPYGHLVLRGGSDGPNYDAKSIIQARAMLAAAGLRQRLVVDCSHGNSNKDWQRQAAVFADVLAQARRGENEGAIAGMMLESYLKAGRQQLRPGAAVAPDLSVTDACMSWEDTAALLR
ncbi:MAG: 3-deoxy-7-phosphoheptulonate synthase [Lentisphaeria bacterium]|jgi:3-deoxy-7-phosphoheptulonate synthase